MEKEKKHSQNTYHQEAITLVLATIDRFEKPESTIPALIDNSIKESYETYPKVVQAISRVFYLIGKQGIALRGHREELDDSKPDNNPAVFYLFLQKLHTMIQCYRSIWRRRFEKMSHILVQPIKMR